MPETLRAYQERGYLSRRGCQRLDKVPAECTDLYNSELQLWRDRYEETGKSDSLFERMKEFTKTRNSDPFWESVSVYVGRGVLIGFEEARKSFYRRCNAGEKPGYPRFKPRHRYRTVQIEQTTAAMLRLDRRGYAVRVKGLPVIRLRTNRNLPAAEELKTIRITFRGRRPSVCLTYAVELNPLPKSSSKVGLDMGVLSRITTSNGERIERRRPDRVDIARKQWGLSACLKGGNRFRRRRRNPADARDRARVKDRNRCHEIATGLVRRYGFIALEDLDKPKTTGSGGAKKRGLNRSILEQAWGRIVSQLLYKAAWADRKLVFVDPRDTSQLCSGCGARVGKSLGDRTHRCACGLVLDRDHNAALNILQKALAGGVFPAAAGEAA